MRGFKAWIDSAGFSTLNPIRLRLLVKNPEAFLPAIKDTPIGEDQKVTRRRNGDVVLMATIQFTLEPSKAGCSARGHLWRC